MERSRIYSKNTIAVQEGEIYEIAGHIPEPLARITHPSLKSWKVYEITCTVTGSRKAPKSTWVLGGGIKLPYLYYLHGPNI